MGSSAQCNRRVPVFVIKIFVFDDPWEVTYSLLLFDVAATVFRLEKVG